PLAVTRVPLSSEFLGKVGQDFTEARPVAATDAKRVGELSKGRDPVVSADLVEGVLEAELVNFLDPDRLAQQVSSRVSIESHRQGYGSLRRGRTALHYHPGSGDDPREPSD